MNKEENYKWKKIINDKSITIYTVIVYLIVITLYEIFFCNVEFINNKIAKLENVQYNFSLIRIIFYVALLIVFFVFRKKFIADAIEATSNKIKRVLIYTYMPIMIVAIATCYVIILKGISISNIMKVTIRIINIDCWFNIFNICFKKSYKKYNTCINNFWINIFSNNRILSCIR